MDIVKDVRLDLLVFWIRAPSSVSGSVCMRQVNHMLQEELELRPLHKWTKSRLLLGCRTNRWVSQHQIYYPHCTGVSPGYPQHSDSVGPRRPLPMRWGTYPMFRLHTHSDPKAHLSRLPLSSSAPMAGCHPPQVTQRDC